VSRRSQRDQNLSFHSNHFSPSIFKTSASSLDILTMIPRKPPRVPFPKARLYSVQSNLEPAEISSGKTENAGEITSETTEKAANSQKFYHNQNRLKPGQSDPKLAGAILELTQGIPHLLVYVTNCNRTRCRSCTAQYPRYTYAIRKSSIWRTHGREVLAPNFKLMY
jgi:hypothetical protein